MTYIIIFSPIVALLIFIAISLYGERRWNAGYRACYKLYLEQQPYAMAKQWDGYQVKPWNGGYSIPTMDDEMNQMIRKVEQDILKNRGSN